MPLIDLINEVQSAQGIAPQSLTQSTQGSPQDFSNCHFSTGAIVDVGSITTANVTSMVVQLEECATTNGTFTVIPGAVCTVTATTTAANLHQVIRGERTQRYVRANAITVAGTTASFPTSVEIIAQRRYGPQGGGFDTYPTSSP